MPTTDKLRRQAEARLRAKTTEKTPQANLVKEQRLLHELEVHQIELEMQNAQLSQTLDELEAANVDLEAFNYTVAHDLRQYLTIINSYCQVTLELKGKDREEHCQEYLEEIYRGALAMDRLIDTLLKFSSVAHGEVRRQSVDLGAIVKSLVKGQVPAAVASLCTFRIAPGILVDADPDLLRVVLDNLIANACKYAGNREGAVIEFGVTSVDGKRACFVRDNGPGFDMALADRLFLPFQRLPGTAVKGHGIGLATVERIIRRHGGKVWAESEPGKGATFFFTLD